MEAGLIREQAGDVRGRVPAVDLARSAALLAMVVYHFVFDLELFGFVPPGTATQPGGWRMLAICTAGSFLALAGVSLVLAHGRGIRWRGFGWRMAMIVAAASVITAGSYVVAPGAFIFFGILHCIAAASLIGLALLRLPALALIALAGGALVLPALVPPGPFDAPVFWITGLQGVRVVALDYVPLFPWLAPFLGGMAVAKLMARAGLWARLAGQGAGMRVLAWPGRHSLLVYLMHQPVLIAGVWLAAQVLR